MKLNKKTAGSFTLLLFLGLVIGSLAWEVIERVAHLLGSQLSLSVGPIGINLDVLVVQVKVNPGSFLGILGAFFLFRRL